MASAAGVGSTTTAGGAGTSRGVPMGCPQACSAALVAIGDRRAVEPLIEMTRKRPPQLVAQVLYALASLGGPTAEAFLYTLESGAPDDEVRHAATDALAELRRKRDEASAHANPTRPRSH